MCGGQCTGLGSAARGGKRTNGAGEQGTQDNRRFLSPLLHGPFLSSGPSEPSAATDGSKAAHAVATYRSEPKQRLQKAEQWRAQRGGPWSPVGERKRGRRESGNRRKVDARLKKGVAGLPLAKADFQISMHWKKLTTADMSDGKRCCPTMYCIPIGIQFRPAAGASSSLFVALPPPPPSHCTTVQRQFIPWQARAARRRAHASLR